MKKKVFRPKMNDSEFLKRFETALNDHIGVYKIIVDKVRDELGITDDRAVQAAAFTLWRQTTDTLSIPNMIFWSPSEDPEENLNNFDQYAEWYGNDTNAFVALCSEYTEFEEDGVRSALRAIELSRDKFSKVKDYLALAKIVNITANILVGAVDEEDEKVLAEVQALNAQAFGIQVGKSVDEIIGSTE